MEKKITKYLEGDENYEALRLIVSEVVERGYEVGAGAFGRNLSVGSAPSVSLEYKKSEKKKKKGMVFPTVIIVTSHGTITYSLNDRILVLESDIPVKEFFNICDQAIKSWGKRK
jgi:hypothetical protein